MPIIKPDAISQTLMFRIVQDSGGTNPGEPATGLDNTDITSAYYVRDREAATAISVSALGSPTASYSSGGFIEIDGTNMPGLYRFDIPNAVVAFGAAVGRAIVQLNMTAASNAIAAPIEIDLDVPRAVWDDLRSRHTTALSLGETIDALTPARGTATAAGATATLFNTNLTETADDHWNGAILVFIGGALDGQARVVTDYNGTTKDVTVNPPFTAAPGNDAFMLIASPGDLLHVLAELPQAAPSATPTVKDLLSLLNMLSRNEIVTGTGSQDIKDDGGTVVFKHALTFASGPKTLTRGELTSGP